MRVVELNDSGPLQPFVAQHATARREPLILEARACGGRIGKPVQPLHDRTAGNGGHVRIVGHFVADQHARPIAASAQPVVNAVGGARRAALPVGGRDMHHGKAHAWAGARRASWSGSSSAPSTKLRCQSWNMSAPHTRGVWSALPVRCGATIWS